MRGKRGAAPVLEETVKFVPHAIIAIAAAMVLVGLINIYFIVKQTIEERDFAQIVRELRDLRPDEAFAIPATALRSPKVEDTKGLVVRLFKEKDPQAPKNCLGKPCICGYTGSDELLKCEVLRLRPCKTPLAGCARAPCIKSSQTVTIEKDKQVLLCRKCPGELRIGTLPANQEVQQTVCPI